MFLKLCFIFLTSCYKTTFNPSKPETISSFEHIFSNTSRYLNQRYYTKANIENMKPENKNELYYQSKSKNEANENNIMKSYIATYNDIADGKQPEYKDIKDDGYNFNIKKYPDKNITVAAILVKKNITPIPVYVLEDFKKYNEYVKNKNKEKEVEKTANETNIINWNQSYNRNECGQQYIEPIFID